MCFTYLEKMPMQCNCSSNSNTIDVAKDDTIITSNENVIIEKVFEIEPFWLDTN